MQLIRRAAARIMHRHSWSSSVLSYPLVSFFGGLVLLVLLLHTASPAPQPPRARGFSVARGERPHTEFELSK